MLTESRSLTIAQSALQTTSFGAQLNGAHPWTAESPELYTLLIELRDEGGRPTDIRSARIGFRTVEVREGRLTINGQAVSIKSSFTAPDGKIHNGSTEFYKHSREVIEHNEWIEVRDTFENLTPENVPVMQTHTCEPTDAPVEI